MFDHLNGWWLYRSFRNEPAAVGDFNAIRLAEAEISLKVDVSGQLSGAMRFPAGAAASEQGLLELQGRVSEGNPLRLQFTGKGRAGTRFADYEYAYDGIVSPAMPDAAEQRLALVGSVMRTRERHSGTDVHHFMTASFIAVKG